MAELTNADNAAALFFAQADRPDKRDRARFHLPEPNGGWLPVTWGDLAKRIEKLASFMIDREINVSSNVAIMANTRIEWGVAVVALMSARGTLVPVYPTLNSDQLAHVLGHSEAELLVVENADMLLRVLRVIDGLNIKTIITMEPVDIEQVAREAGIDPDAVAAVTFRWGQAAERGAESLRAEPKRVRDRIEEIRLSDVAYLVYTSGTTGMPKGVPLTHYNVGSSGSDWMEANGELVCDGDVDILWLPMSHLYGLGEFFLGNQIGFTTYLSDPLNVMPQLPEVSPHVFMSVPAYWEKLMQLAQTVDGEATQYEKLAELTGGRLRFCLSGGAGLAREVKEFFLAAGVMIIEGYGLTECSPNLTMNNIDDFDFDTVGKPVPGVTLQLGPDGEILAKGANVFGGYFKDEEATAAVFDDEGWFHTGDLGEWTDRGFLKIIGRKKEILVTSSGKNIPPVNIEIRFKDFPLINQLVVYGDGKKYLTALVDINDVVAKAQLEAAGEQANGNLRKHPLLRQWVQKRIDQVNAQLARFETVKKFCIADEPLTVEGDDLTPTLKVKRDKVYQRFHEQLEALYD